MKCFSLKSFSEFEQYDKILSLLRRMSNLERLSLHLLIKGRNKVIDGPSIQDDILNYMLKLHSFTFYISTYLDVIYNPFSSKISSEDIQKTLTNIRQENVASIVNYFHYNKASCAIFSLPFAFDRLLQIGNKFPNIIFNHVTYLYIQDIEVLRHEFFIRLAQSFPVLKFLGLRNCQPQSSFDERGNLVELNPSKSIIEYPHLTSLDVRYTFVDYADQFLNETKACVPCLTQLDIYSIHLEDITNNFTRDDTRRNCAKIKRLLSVRPVQCTPELHAYFPLLEM